MKEVALATFEAADLACQERTIYRRGGIYLGFMPVCARPGPDSVHKPRAGILSAVKAQWLALTFHPKMTNAPL